MIIEFFVMKTMAWLADAEDFDEFNRAYGEFFPGKRPARSTIQESNVAATRIEIEAIAYRPN